MDAQLVAQQEGHPSPLLSSLPNIPDGAELPSLKQIQHRFDHLKAKGKPKVLRWGLFSSLIVQSGPKKSTKGPTTSTSDGSSPGATPFQVSTNAFFSSG
jgi:hypothetical protein